MINPHSEPGVVLVRHFATYKECGELASRRRTTPVRRCAKQGVANWRAKYSVISNCALAPSVLSWKHASADDWRFGDYHSRIAG